VAKCGRVKPSGIGERGRVWIRIFRLEESEALVHLAGCDALRAAAVGFVASSTLLRVTALSHQCRTPQHDVDLSTREENGAGGRHATVCRAIINSSSVGITQTETALS
jgi:hypothetical protein